MPKIEDNRLLAALNYGISKVTSQQHINGKKLDFILIHGVIRLDSPPERVAIFSDTEDGDEEYAAVADDEHVQCNRREPQQERNVLNRILAPEEQVSEPESEESFDNKSFSSSISGQGVGTRKSIRQFLPTKEIREKLNLYILENKSIGNDSKLAFHDDTEVLDNLLKR